MKKLKKTKDKSLPVQVVKEDKPIEQVDPYWRAPTAHSLKLDEARLAYYWARLNGLSLEPFLKAWAALLHVPRTRVKA